MINVADGSQGRWSLTHRAKGPTARGLQLAAGSSYRRRGMALPGAELPLKGGVPGWARLLLVVVLLFGFLVGVKHLEVGIAAMGADFVDAVVAQVASPLSGLFAGILMTVLMQSSSVSSSTIVGLVGSGLLPFPIAVPMIMGANIGTTVTNTLASLGHVRHGAEFRRALAAATMHDFFNLLAVALLFPLELLTGFISRSALALSDLMSGVAAPDPDRGEGLLRSAIRLPVSLVESGLDVVGARGAARGILLLSIGLALIFTCLALIIRNMRRVMAARFERALNALLGRGAGLGALALGVVVTVMVQSSSITTSILIPLVAAGILSLPNAFPVTLGANLGTTITALLASLATTRPEALAIALTHTLFNVCGILIFYPIPALRHIPLRLAEMLANLAVNKKRWALIYMGGLFVVGPLVGLIAIR